MLYEMLSSAKIMLSKSKKSQAKDPRKNAERTQKKKRSRESVPEEAQLLDLLEKEFKTNYYYKTFLKRWE